MQIHLNLQFVLLVVAIGVLATRLSGRAYDAQPRRFVTLCILCGLLGVAAVGAYFRTPVFAKLLGLQPAAIVEKSVQWLKAFIALAAAGLSLYEVVLIKQKKQRLLPHWAKGIAAALAVMAVGAYFRFGDLGYSQFYHRWEFYHYYMGSKYNREIGYERLYRCTAVAQAELGQLNEVRARKLRDLAIDVLSPTQPVLDQPEECKSHFTPERWEAYKKDVVWFRNSSNLQYWNDMQKDHGYNPPPVWTVMGYFLGSFHAASDGFFKLLALLDPLFFVGAFAAVYWAFGWRVCTVALIFWGCQLPAEYFWTGGAFMRQDWLFYLVLSGCLIRKRYYALGGAAFAYSTLLRVFPGALIAGWVVVIVAHFWKHKRLAPSHIRLVAGGVAATAILVSVSIGVAGTHSYAEFWKHINVHNTTPLTNNMGLQTVVSHGLEGRMQVSRDETQLDPFKKWKDMRRERLHAYRFFYAAIVLAIGAALARVAWRIKSLWIVQALSLGLLVSIVEVTCYYYSMFILAAFLSRLRKGVEQVLLVGAAVSQLCVVNPILAYYYDDRYTAQSVVFCVLGVVLITMYWPPKKAAATALGAGAPPGPALGTPPAGKPSLPSS
jgi:hypothetical protein